MTLAAPLHDDPHHLTPRAQGVLRIGVKAGNRLDTLRQSGASKALFPRHAGGDLLAVTLNTAGGVTGGDRFSIAAQVAQGGHLTLTTQTAERIYKAQPGQTARMTTEAALAPGARLDWLPQETILFDRCRLRRRLTVDMAEDAIFLGVETLVLGRALMGERIEAGFAKDDVRITRGSDLVFADAIALDGAISDQMAAAWCGGPANCLASVTYVAPDAEARLNTLRALMPANAGVSLIRDGVLFARVLAADSHDLRRALIPVLTALRGPLPPTWTL